MTRTTLIVCNTCGNNPEQPEAQRLGDQLASYVERVLPQDGPIKLQRFSCLMACQRKCTVQLRSAGKMGYTLGDFIPDQEHAAALVEYATLHQESETGQVPYNEGRQRFLK